MDDPTTLPGLTPLVDRLELRLLAAAKLQEPVTIALPYGPDHLARTKIAWACVEKLRRRGITLRVDVAPHRDGQTMLLEDRTPSRSAA